MKKGILILTILTLALSSCKFSAPPEQRFMPGQDRLPEPPQLGMNYYVRRLDDRVLPAPMRAMTQPLQVRAVIEQADTLVSSLDAVTDQGGVVAVEDPLLGAVVPVVALDEDHQPIVGIQIRYVHSAGFVTLSASDPQGRFESLLVVAPVEVLLVAPRGSQNRPELLAGVFSPHRAYAAPVRALPIAAGLIVVLKVASVVGAVEDAMVLVGLNGRDLVASAAGVEYVCMSPAEIERAEARSVSRAVLTLVRPAKNLDQYRRVALAMGKVIGPTLVSNSVASIEEEVTLFRRFLYPTDQLEAIYGGLPRYASGEVGDLFVLEPAEEVNPETGEYEAVGRCVEPPDLLNQPIGEARSTLSRSGIPWREICTNEPDSMERYVVPGFDAPCPDGLVVRQSHWKGDLIPILEDDVSTGSMIPLPTFALTVGLNLRQLGQGDGVDGDDPTKGRQQVVGDPADWLTGIEQVLFPDMQVKEQVAATYEDGASEFTWRSHGGECGKEADVSIRVLRMPSLSAAEDWLGPVDGLDTSPITVGDEAIYSAYDLGSITCHQGADLSVFKVHNVELYLRRANAVAQIYVGIAEGRLDQDEVLALALAVSRLIDSNVVAEIDS